MDEDRAFRDVWTWADTHHAAIMAALQGAGGREITGRHAEALIEVSKGPRPLESVAIEMIQARSYLSLTMLDHR